MSEILFEKGAFGDFFRSHHAYREEIENNPIKSSAAKLGPQFCGWHSVICIQPPRRPNANTRMSAIVNPMRTLEARLAGVTMIGPRGGEYSIDEVNMFP